MRSQKEMNAAGGDLKPDKPESQLHKQQIGGYRVRAGVRAGDWQCNSCSGKTMGTQLFKAHCDSCIKE